MATGVHREKIQLDIEVGGNQARKQLNDLKESSAELKAEQKALRSEKAKLVKEDANYKSEVKRLNAALKENKAALQENADQQAKLREKLGMTALTSRELYNELRHLKQVQSNLVPGTAPWTAYQKKIQAVEQRMFMLRTGASKLGIAIKDMATMVNHYAGIFMAIGFAIYGAYNLFIKGNKELTDQLADVQRYTNLTNAELMALYNQLMKLDTRTPREELLSLAGVAGKLGINGRQNILQFVSAADKIKVALGEDLADNAEDGIKEVGKLVSIFKLDQKFGLETALLKVGSSINSVGQASTAQESYLVDFTKRVAGIAPIADISITKVIGLAATLDILGQSAEVSSTVYAQVIPNMFKDTEVYAGIARMKVSDFSKLLKTDANAAFLKLLEGLNGNNDGMDQMAARLTDLGLEGKRAVTVMGVLAGNIDLIKQQQAYASQEFDKGTSILTEFNLKNQNLAGNMDKIGKVLKNIFTGGAIMRGLTAFTGKIVEWMQIPMSEQIAKEQASLNSLVIAITNSNNTQETRNALIKELQQTYPNFLGNLDAEKVTNEELSNRLRDVNKEYESKILLAVKEEALTENYKQRTTLRLDELDLIKKISDAEQIAARARAKITPGMDPNSYRTILTQEEFNALNDLPIFTKALADNRKAAADLVNQENALNEAIKSMGLTPGQSASAFSGKKETPDPENDPAVKETIDVEALRIAALEKGKAAELALEDKRHNEQLQKYKYNAKALEYENIIHAKNMNDINKKFLDQQLADNTVSYQLRMGQLKDSLDKGEITQQQYDDRARKLREKWDDDILKYRKGFVSLSNQQLMDEEIAAAQKRGKELGLKEEEIQAAIQTIRDKYAKKEIDDAANKLEFKKAYLSVSNEELMNTEIAQARARGEELKLTEEEIQKAIASIKKKYAKKGTKEMAANLQEQIDLIVQGMDAQQQAWMRKAQGMMQVTEQLGEAFGTMFADILSGQEDFGQSFLLLALDMIQKYINLLLAKMLAESMAQADSVATFGATGAARFVVLSAIVNAAFGLAKGAIRNSGKTTQKRTGGYADILGADDNRRYNAQVLTAAATGFLPAHPVLMPSGILASEAGREYYVDNPSLRSSVRDQLGLTIADHVRIIEAMKQTYAPQRAAGGYADPSVPQSFSPSSFNPSITVSGGISDETALKFVDAVDRLMGLEIPFSFQEFDRKYDQHLKLKNGGLKYKQ